MTDVYKRQVCGEKMMAKSVGALVHAFADATVPKVNVVIGKAFGTAYTAMNSKAIGADMVYACLLYTSQSRNHRIFPPRNQHSRAADPGR